MLIKKLKYLLLVTMSLLSLVACSTKPLIPLMVSPPPPINEELLTIPISKSLLIPCSKSYSLLGFTPEHSLKQLYQHFLYNLGQVQLCYRKDELKKRKNCLKILEKINQFLTHVSFRELAHTLNSFNFIEISIVIWFTYEVHLLLSWYRNFITVETFDSVAYWGAIASIVALIIGALKYMHDTLKNHNKNS